MSELRRDGYEVVPLAAGARAAVLSARARLERVFGWPLETYHERSEKTQDEEQEAASSLVRHVGCEVTYAHYEYVAGLLGHDLHITAKPYLRLSRPGVSADNIGYHRDTWYGDSAYELGVWIALTTTDERNCLLVSPGSHVWADSEHPWAPFERGDVEKGSIKHRLGVPYAGKRLIDQPPMIPVPVRLGEMLVFSLALLHGQEVNRSDSTRVSVDFRLVNSYAPVVIARSRSSDYYVRLCSSTVSDIAHRYEEANA